MAVMTENASSFICLGLFLGNLSYITLKLLNRRADFKNELSQICKNLLYDLCFLISEKMDESIFSQISRLWQFVSSFQPKFLVLHMKILKEWIFCQIAYSAQCTGNVRWYPIERFPMLPPTINEHCKRWWERTMDNKDGLDKFLNLGGTLYKQAI